jgi:dihydroneopterin aldolase
MESRGTAERLVYALGIRLCGPIGFRPEERACGTVVDADIIARLAPSVRVGSLEDSVDYAALCRLAHAEAAAETELLETLAEEIADEVFARWPQVDAVQVKLVKPAAPVDLPVQGLGFRLTKIRPGGLPWGGAA